MGLSKESRILALLVIDVIFFFVEILFGYAVGSIALIADSFHMLNDVISLIVALYAIKLATASSTSKYSYGWQRAEILGALINGVFLLALCFSIFLECIQRLFTVPEVSSPIIVVIVGSFGLASNIVGLFLFSDVHGGGGHSHSHGGPAEPTPPARRVKPNSSSSNPSSGGGETAPLLKGSGEQHHRSDSISSLYGHPAHTRDIVIRTAEQMGYGAHEHSHGNGGHEHGGKKKKSLDDVEERSDAGHDHDHSHSHSSPSTSPSYPNYGSTNNSPSAPSSHDHDHSHSSSSPNKKEPHSHGGGGGGGHSHSDMNLRGVFLHVLGDALGNVGVIASGLVIWLCEGQWRFYSDPLISFIITIIIFSSALPLVKSASFILLQAVPSSINLEDLRASILDVPGVISVHELHCWQLSESKIVASVHVFLERGGEGEGGTGGEGYMEVVGGIREVLHDYGIHSSTIQPEFASPSSLSSSSAPTPFDTASSAALAESGADDCLIRCPPEADCAPSQCCPPGVSAPQVISGEEAV